MNLLPFSQILADNLIQQKERVEGRKASLILIDGGLGEGKTTLMLHCMDYLNSLYGVPPVKLEVKDHPQLSMGGVEFNRQFKECFDLKLPCVGYDEAGDYSKRGALSRFNATLNRVFETFRGFKMHVILALPSFTGLDNGLFENNIPRLLLHCYGRTLQQGNIKAYSLPGMNWVRYWADQLPKGAKYKCYSKVDPNFYAHFKDLSPERSRQLDLISTRGKIQLLAKQQISLEGLLTYYELSKSMGKSVIWLRKQIASLGLKPARVLGNVAYFDSESINEIESRLRTIKPRGRPKR